MIKKHLSLFLILILLTLTGCGNNGENPSDLSDTANQSISETVSDTKITENTRTAEINTEATEPTSEERSLFSQADECARDFQKLFLNYLQNDPDKLCLTLEKAPSAYSSSYYSVVDDEIKGLKDIKGILREYCTEELSEKLLKDALYLEDEKGLYKGTREGGSLAEQTYGCYISDCFLKEDKMLVEFTEIGTDNEDFEIDREKYRQTPERDRRFIMTLVRDNGKWLISDCGVYKEIIGYAYRSDIAMSSAEGAQPPAATDPFAAADKSVQNFKSLFLKYLQYETDELYLKIDSDPSAVISDTFLYRPVADEKIKCREDLKKILREQCTDEFTERLLNDAFYRDFEGRLYKADRELSPTAKFSYGCYINDCILKGNKILAELTEIGADNKDFDFDRETYNMCPAQDTHFYIMLVWEKDEWLISDCYGYEGTVGYGYRGVMAS